MSTILQNYIACLGLIGLGVYQLTQGEFQTALQSLLAGLALLGIHASLNAFREETK